MERECEEMREKLGGLEEAKRDGVWNKVKYMEGAVWMGRRMVAEVEKLG